MTPTSLTSTPPISTYESSPFSKAALVLGPKIPSTDKPASLSNSYNAP